MTTIPPVEERQNRLCEICVFDRCSEIKRNGKLMHLCFISKFSNEDEIYSFRNGQPCDAHFTFNELQTIIDQHNTKHQEIPEWFKKIIRAELKHQYDTPNAHSHLFKPLLKRILSMKPGDKP